VQYFTENSLRQQLHEAGLDVIEIHAIMHSQYARQEFMRRIKHNYKYDLVRRILVYLRLRDEDRRSENCEGMMLIGRARRPST
jgi:isopropylmalate/homocitrate/citramalate synthase